MKRLLVAAAALALLALSPAAAADMPMGYGAPPPIPIYNWTGFYLGAHIGGGWNGTDWLEDASSSGSGAPPGFLDGTANASGFLAGGQAGFDFQTGMFVWGILADGSWADLTGNSGCFFGAIPGATQTCSQSINSLGTIAARVGAAYNNFLFYFTTGGAWEHEQLQNTCLPVAVCAPPSTLSATGVNWGWTVGVGLEWAFARDWSAFLQYNFVDFGTRDVSFAGVFTEDIRENTNIVKAGVNYRFGWGPRY